MSAVKDDHPAHLPYLVGAAEGRELRGRSATIVRGRLTHTHLDELVVAQRPRDRVGDTFGETVVAKLHHGLNVMRKPSQVASLFAREIILGTTGWHLGLAHWAFIPRDEPARSA